MSNLCQQPTYKSSQFLSKAEARNQTLSEIKLLLKEVETELANKITALVYEIYLDAHYRERTNIQMKDTIIKLEHQLGKSQQRPVQMVYGPSQAERDKIEHYERMVRQSAQQIQDLTEQLQLLQTQNHQLRTQLASSSLDHETQFLIQNLTAQMQTQKGRNKELTIRCQQLERQIQQIQQQLTRMSRRRQRE